MAGFGDQKKKNKSTPKGKAHLGGEGLLKTAVDDHMRGDLVSAEKAYRAAIKAGYMHPVIFSNLGIICKNSERIEEAILLYEKAIEVSPSDPNPYTNLGNLYQELGQLDQALASTLKSLELKPHNPDALMNLGGIYKVLGQLDQALAATLKSIELKPDNPDALPNLGGIYQQLGQLDQALGVTLKSLELKPDNPTAHMKLGGIYQQLGQLDQALAATLKSLEIKPDNGDALINLGGIYQQLGQLDQALAATLKSLELKPDHPTAHMNLGGIYQELGQLDQALAATLKSLELKTDNGDALINLGGIYKDLGLLDQALAATLKSLELKPDHPTAHMNLGGIYQELSKVRPELIDNSIIAFSNSLRINPNNANTKLGLSAARNKLITSQEVMTINNAKRSNAFYNAISHAMKGGECVVELGKSTGIYSMIAADKGALSVTKLVESEIIRSASEAVVATNKYGDKVDVAIHHSEKENDTKDLMLKADLVITDLLSVNPSNIKNLLHMAELSKKFQKENGRSIPESVEVKGALLGESSEINDLLKVAIVNGYDLSKFNNILTKNHSYKLYEKPNIISKAANIIKINFIGSQQIEKSEQYVLMESVASKTCIGIAIWSKLNLFDKISYEENPTIDNQRNYLIIHLFERSFRIRSGQIAKIKYLINDEMGAWFEFVELLNGAK